MPEYSPLQKRPDAELIRLAHRSKGQLAKESLAVLVNRDAPKAASVAAELLAAHADPQVRSLAAVSLGRGRGLESSAPLAAALSDVDPTVIRRAAQSLVRVGDASALVALGQLATPADPVAGEAVRTARLLLGYRLGRAESLITATGVTEFGRRRGEQISFSARAKTSKETICAAVSDEVPALTFKPANLAPFTCSGAAGVVAVAEQTEGFDFSVPQMIGVLARERVCSQRYSLDCFVLSDDRDGTSGRQPYIWLVRPSGRVVYTGRAQVAGEEVRFEINGAVSPSANPVKVVGAQNAKGQLSIETALVGKPATDAPKAASAPLRMR